MTKAFVYTELQISVPFDSAPWRAEPRPPHPAGVQEQHLAGRNRDPLGRRLL